MSRKGLETLRGRSMGSYILPSGNSGGREPRSRGRKRSVAPLSGKRIRIRTDRQHLRAGLVGQLTYLYNLRTGAYYALLDGQGLETVVRPRDYELLEDAA